MRTIHTVIVLTAAIGLLTAAGEAQAPDSSRVLVVTADNLTAVESPSARTGNSKALRPGDIVRYRLTFTNTRPDSVRSVRFNDPVPAGLRYVPGSARADRSDVLVEFSIDGGRTYSERPEIEEVANGEKVRRPAPPERYTNVRWSARGWVQPKGKISSEFSVQLPSTIDLAAGSGAKKGQR